MTSLLLKGYDGVKERCANIFKRNQKINTELNNFDATGNASGMVDLANESTMLKLKQVRIEPGANDEGSDSAPGGVFDGDSII